MEDELIGKVWQNFGLLHENYKGANLFLHEKLCGGAAESGKRISKTLMFIILVIHTKTF